MVLLASEFDLSRFLNAEGYGERDKKFRIADVTSEVLERNGKAEDKLTLWFTNSKQGLVLNKTNLRTLKGAFGDDTSKWVNKIIVIYLTTANFGGKMVPALRVRIPPPKQAAAAPQQSAPAPTGNGAAAAAAPVAAAALTAAAAAVAAQAAVVDPELEPDPVKPIGEDLDDEVAF